MSTIVPDVLHVVVLTHEPGASMVPSQFSGRPVIREVISLPARENICARIATLDPDAVVIDTRSASDAQIVDDLLATWPNLPLVILDRTQPPHDWSPSVARGVEDVLTGQTLAPEQIDRAIHHAVLRRRRSAPVNAPLATLTDGQLAALVNVRTEPTIVIDGSGRLVAVNDGFCTLLECEREEALRLHPADVLQASVRSPGTADQRVTSGLRLYSRGTLVNGTRRIEVSVSAGRIRRDRYELVFFDMRHLAPAESVLRESESLFRAMAESSPTAVYIEQDQQVVYANPAAAALTGVPVDELIGRDPLSFVHPDWRATLDERRRLRLAGEPVQSRYEVKMQGREGRDGWLDLTAAPVAYRGRPALLVNAIDISERRRLEEQLMLPGRLEAVGRLAGGIAHDFNNLLQVVHGHVERLQDAISPADPLRDSIAAISGAAARATSLTEQLLAVGRRQLLLPKSVDLNALVSRFSTQMLRSLPPNIRLHVNQATDLPAVRIDEARLEQALSHLVSNAREAMPDGGVLTINTRLVSVDDQELKPRLRAERTSAQPGTYVAVEVQDTGRGMTPEVMTRAFEPFFSTKPNAPGAGLGLSTVYGIVKQSGGYLTGESTPGKGTSWSVWLPPAGAFVPVAPNTQQPAPEQLRILLVEDEPAVRSLLYETLKRDGLNVVAFGSAEEALESWVDHSFDILITDVGLPGLTGPQLAKALLARDPDLRIVFISGYVADSLGSSDIDPNAIFLQKPFNPRELAKRVRQVAAHPIAKP